MGFVIGVDVGGTFTDVVLRAKETRRGTLAVAKVLSTHYDPIAGILAGVTRALGDRDPAQVERVVHATTPATNAVLERTGVRVALVTTQGFRATVPLGRYARVEEDRYDLRFTPPPPPVAPGDCFEVVERMSARGAVLTPLDPESVRAAAAGIVRRGIGSAAVCLLHAYANPAHERQVAAILRESVPNVVTSSDVWPEIREYERATTTIRVSRGDRRLEATGESGAGGPSRPERALTCQVRASQMSFLVLSAPADIVALSLPNVTGGGVCAGRSDSCCVPPPGRRRRWRRAWRTTGSCTTPLWSTAAPPMPGRG
ncbi:hydantoinase/oxoprolinase N-terminal domain-containing protein [Nonomuraea sp. B10E15]|uniref:hydantoinase/oxoprolinase N-terminal domain-containing protein n=1 Tax=Nonomuraea sp. B10E15 TaxID=3153560 RepID=UPI00325D7373